MCKKPVISVIMPVYNAEKFLERAIQSILDQTFKDFELIIINDGSKDQSDQIIKSFSDHRIVYINNEKNLGLTKTLNKGVKLAKGDFIARMDSDDISFPVRFETQVEIFNSYSGIDMINTMSIIMTEEGRPKNINKYSVGFEALKFVNVFNCLVVHPSIMIKTEVMKRYYYREESASNYIEDLDLWTRMLGDGCVIYTIERPLLYYRIVGDSINRKHYHQQRKNHIRILSQYLMEENCFLSIREEDLRHFVDLRSRFRSLKEAENFHKMLRMYFRHIARKNVLSRICIRDMKLWMNYMIFKKYFSNFIKNKNFVIKFYSLIKIMFAVSPSFYQRNIKKILH
ncbi:glycosyltransferase family 2 protein [Sphingobacterium multivorum]|uniref:glycosyltransferase family 2 protein n=1 Tax=Sphingobacterium multivorum TaxID=28454 RepID=UPI000EDEB121|nr:glycosyltransferase [Sphingobacterium multivorum]HAF36760.1 hypothetical protein [Sphingobacterium sp.]